MMAHIRSDHFLPDGQPRRSHFVESMFPHVDVLRPERYFAPPRPDPSADMSAEADVVEPLTGIAARQQRSDAVSSIWEVERLLHMFCTLLDYAAFPASCDADSLLYFAASAQGHLPQLRDVVRWCLPPWAAVSVSLSGKRIRVLSLSRAVTSSQVVGKGAA